MGGISHIPVFVLAAFLVFGCLGAPETVPAPQAPSNGEPAPPSETPAPAEPGKPAPADPAQPDSLEGLGYEALLALGQSLECDVTASDYLGNVMTLKVYMKGSDNVRSEFTSTESAQSPCPRFVSIAKGIAEGRTSYMGCMGGDLFEGSPCDWLMMVTDAAGPSDPSAAGGFEQPALDDIPPSRISCKLWIYDPSKFDTPGRVCTMEELIQSYYPETYGYE